MWIWLLACRTESPAYVAPYDGASSVNPGDPLRAVFDGGAYPEGEPVPDDVIVVVDLDDGGAVRGEARVEDGAVVFLPDEPWREGGAYGWAVTAPAPVARRPLLDVPLDLEGEASFRVGGSAALLDAAIEGGRLCLLFSAPLPWIGAIEVDGEPLDDLDGEPLALPAPRPPGDSPARCVPALARVGDVVRYTGPDGSTSAARVSSRPLGDRWRERHRWSRG